MKTLAAKGMIEDKLFRDNEDNPYTVYKATAYGEGWVIANQGKLVLKRDPDFPF